MKEEVNNVQSYIFEKCTPRVAALREKVLGAPQICTERAYLMTESYKKTEGEPKLFQRVRAMDHILQNISIGISDGEIIVGRSTSKNRGAPLIPELQWKWYLDEIDELSTRQWDRCAPITDEEKVKMRECLPYWEGQDAGRVLDTQRRSCGTKKSGYKCFCFNCGCCNASCAFIG